MLTRTARRQKSGGPTSTVPGFTFTRHMADIRGTGCRFIHFHFHHAYVDYPFYLPEFQFRSAMSADEKETVRIENRHDRWRYTCPRSHRTWEPTNHHFWCASCARADGVDGVFDELRDRRSGRLLSREEVQLVTPVGPYDEDLDYREGSA